MENQHRKIIGYQDFDQDTINLINEIKEAANKVGQLVGKVNSGDVDKRWSAIAATDLQKGFMALVRAVTQPESF